MERVTISVQINVIPGQTVKDTVDWVARCFDYYHRRLQPKVEMKNVVVTGEPSEPTTSELL